MEGWPGDLVRLLLAVLLGGIIGLEREVRDKPAGFRTMILIAVGSALFTIFSVRIADNLSDPGRLAAQIVTGVGFLGAGAIMRERKHVTGLTTAAAIWLVASLGIGAGMGEFKTTLLAAVLVLVVLLSFSRLERWVDTRREERNYEVLVRQQASLDHVRHLAEESGVRLTKTQVGKLTSGLRIIFVAVGPKESHKILLRSLLVDEAIAEFTQD